MLRQLVDISLDAGRLIMDVYDLGGAQASFKHDGSPVTVADQRAERLILERLRAAAPDIPIVAEEAMSDGQKVDGGSRVFLVDPLDGTKEFLTRNGEFTVNIALIENGRPTLGVVYAPALGEIYAADGRQSFHAQVSRGDLGSLREISCRAAPASITAVGSRSHAQSETSDWLSDLPVDNMLSKGSSLKFCLVAKGEADLYPRLGRTMEWDTAAGHAVLQAAGGQVMTLSGVPLTYNKSMTEDPFGNPHFVAIGDPRLVGRIKWNEPSRSSALERQV